VCGNSAAATQRDDDDDGVGDSVGQVARGLVLIYKVGMVIN